MRCKMTFTRLAELSLYSVIIFAIETTALFFIAY